MSEAVTVHHGDCLEVMRAMPSSCVDAVVTDPPYSINTKSDGTGKLNPWADLCNASLWYSTWIAECRRLLKPSGVLWSCLNWRSMPTFQKSACDIGWPIESIAVWDKAWIGPGGQRGLRPSYELLALWCCEDGQVRDRGVPDVVRIKWSSHKPNGHPAEKPVELMEWAILHTTNPGDLILDPFCGSGTTGEASVRAGRRFIGIEIDKTWADAARVRCDQNNARSLFTGATP